MTRINELKDKLKRLDGVASHNNIEQEVDKLHFWLSIKEDYTKKEIIQAKNELEAEKKKH